MLKKIFLLSILIFSCDLFAIERVKISGRFGTINISNSEQDTFGTSLILESELYLAKEWGLLLSAGIANTESDTLVTTDSNDRTSSFKIRNQFFQGGYFIYPIEGLRVTSGLGAYGIETEFVREGGQAIKNDEKYLGAFFSLGYTYYFSNFLIGAEYNYALYDKFSQSGLYFIFGLTF